MRLGFSFRPSSHVTGLVLGLHMLCPSLHVGVSEHSAHSRPASYTRMNAPPPFNSISAAQRSASDLARPTVKPERKLPKVPCRRNTSLSGRMALKSSCVVASALPCRCQLQISLQISCVVASALPCRCRLQISLQISSLQISCVVASALPCRCQLQISLQILSTADITADIVRRCLCSALQVSTAEITADIVTADVVRRCLCSALQVSTADINEYRAQIKAQVRKALADVEREWGGPSLQSEWMVVYIRPQGLDPQDKASNSSCNRSFFLSITCAVVCWWRALNAVGLICKRGMACQSLCEDDIPSLAAC